MRTPSQPGVPPQVCASSVQASASVQEKHARQLGLSSIQSTGAPVVSEKLSLLPDVVLLVEPPLVSVPVDSDDELDVSVLATVVESSVLPSSPVEPSRGTQTLATPSVALSAKRQPDGQSGSGKLQ